MRMMGSSGIKSDSGNLQLQKEAEKAKKERRKERKKEKREEKKRRRDEENKKHGHEKGYKHERSHVDHKEGDLQKRKENETEQLEKSTLTEEHGQAFGSENLCNSTESTLNSDKRQKQKQKQSSPADSKPNHGSIIRIRLPLQRHKDPEVLPNTEQPCSSSISGRTNNLVQEMREFPSSSTEQPDHLQQECLTSSQIGPELISQPSKEKSRTGTSQTDAHSQRVESASSSCSRSRAPHPIELQFRDLMQKWTAHSLQSDCADLYDEGWLFETKLDHDSRAKRFKTTDGSCCSKDTLLPCASYLPEDIRNTDLGKYATIPSIQMFVTWLATRVILVTIWMFSWVVRSWSANARPTTD
ncbi:hypothetical protein RJ641_010863, partial [Dillenia turbinata]